MKSGGTAFCFGLMAFFALTRGAFAAVLPDSYPLQVTEAPLTQLDPALQAWLQEHTQEVKAATLEPAAFDKVLSAEDPTVQMYLRLSRAAEAGKLPHELLSEGLEFVQKQLDAAQTQNPHPMLPYVIAVLLDSEELSGEQSGMLQRELRNVGPHSCPQKENFMATLKADRLKTLSLDELRALIDETQIFYSPRFRSRALEAFLRALPETMRGPLLGKIVPLARESQSVTHKFSWLVEASPNGGEGKAGFAVTRDLARKGRCKQAQPAFVEALKKIDPLTTLSDAISAGSAVDHCYRAKGGLNPAILFWREISEPMAKLYGFPGAAAAQQRIAVLDWTAERHDEARAALSALKLQAKELKNRQVEAKAVYTLGRIAEDLNEHSNAVALYAAYVDQFSDLENFEAAFMSLVTLRAIDRQWAEVMAPLQRLIGMQSELPMDERAPGVLSFALFWAGRVHLELGQRDLAREMWRRLATEYYSTFYGALGHYLVEKSTGKQLLLEPSRTASYRPQSLRVAFVGRDRDTFDRASTLLRLGYKSSALCEVAELDTTGRAPEKMLSKALFLHVAGDWLDAIKLYDALPRSFRNALPIGFERILFPRAYETQVVELSRRLNLDPDFVFALIRQESVYNPRAQSPAGAMGLMQLMPATARLEIQRLSRGYLSPVEKRETQHSVATPRAILDPLTNLRLGVHHVFRLMSKYKSPIFALTAYNASPNAAERWIKEIPSDDLLAFIERIPYAETRSYVKLILRNYFYYKRWYSTPNNVFKHLDAVTSPLLAMAKGQVLGVNGGATPETEGVTHDKREPNPQ